MLKRLLVFFVLTTAVLAGSAFAQTQTAPVNIPLKQREKVLKLESKTSPHKTALAFTNMAELLGRGIPQAHYASFLQQQCDLRLKLGASHEVIQSLAQQIYDLGKAAAVQGDYWGTVSMKNAAQLCIGKLDPVYAVEEMLWNTPAPQKYKDLHPQPGEEAKYVLPSEDVRDYGLSTLAESYANKKGDWVKALEKLNELGKKWDADGGQYCYHAVGIVYAKMPANIRANEKNSAAISTVFADFATAYKNGNGRKFSTEQQEMVYALQEIIPAFSEQQSAEVSTLLDIWFDDLKKMEEQQQALAPDKRDRRLSMIGGQNYVGNHKISWARTCEQLITAHSVLKAKEDYYCKDFKYDANAKSPSTGGSVDNANPNSAELKRGSDNNLAFAIWRTWTLPEGPNNHRDMDLSMSWFRQIDTPESVVWSGSVLLVTLSNSNDDKSVQLRNEVTAKMGNDYQRTIKKVGPALDKLAAKEDPENLPYWQLRPLEDMIHAAYYLSNDPNSASKQSSSSSDEKPPNFDDLSAGLFHAAFEMYKTEQAKKSDRPAREMVGTTFLCDLGKFMASRENYNTTAQYLKWLQPIDQTWPELGAGLYQCLAQGALENDPEAVKYK